MFDVIERLKADWTDKYVVIASAAPELARFASATGQVKTVNMNGRCLVEFDQFNNVGWYDIDPAALRVVPKPEPKPVEKAEKSAKPAAPAKAAPAAKSAAPAAAAGKKPSTADILAAARGKGTGTAPSKPAGGRPSTAEILAAARGKAAPPAATPKSAAAPEPVAEEPAAAEPEAPTPKVAPRGKATASGPLPTTTAEKIAWCRTRDAKG